MWPNPQEIEEKGEELQDVLLRKNVAQTLWIWSYLRKKSLMETFVFCAVVNIWLS